MGGAIQCQNFKCSSEAYCQDLEDGNSNCTSIRKEPWRRVGRVCSLEGKGGGTRSSELVRSGMGVGTTAGSVSTHGWTGFLITVSLSLRLLISKLSWKVYILLKDTFNAHNSAVPVCVFVPASVVRGGGGQKEC